MRLFVLLTPFSLRIQGHNFPVGKMDFLLIKFNLLFSLNMKHLLEFLLKTTRL